MSEKSAYITQRSNSILHVFTATKPILVGTPFILRVVTVFRKKRLWVVDNNNQYNTISGKKRPGFKWTNKFVAKRDGTSDLKWVLDDILNT